MRAASPALVMTDAEREVLERWERSQSASHGEVQRAKALLAAADGEANTAIAARLGVSPATVTSWRARFGSHHLAGFGVIAKGRGRKPSIPKAKIDAIVEATLHSEPPGERHWSTRTMAKAQGVSPATVQRIWHARGLKPHRVDAFKLSNDKRFEEKLVDVVGLYLSPPDQAVVLCLDELCEASHNSSDVKSSVM
jgi:transposase